MLAKQTLFVNCPKDGSEQTIRNIERSMAKMNKQQLPESVATESSFFTLSISLFLCIFSANNYFFSDRWTIALGFFTKPPNGWSVFEASNCHLRTHSLGSQSTFQQRARYLVGRSELVERQRLTDHFILFFFSPGVLLPSWDRAAGVVGWLLLPGGSYSSPIVAEGNTTTHTGWHR